MKFATIALTLLLTPAAWADTVVAQDGSGQFKTVQQAVDAAPSHSRAPYVIHIKPGTYKGHIVVPHSKPFLSFLGENAKATILTDDLSATMPGADGKPIGTFRTPSTTIEADDFVAENLTFENSAGPGQKVAQAVALAVLGDRVVFRNCRFLGSQDTLLAQTGRQYFENSYIEGGVDFIFGGSTAYFDRCQIHSTSNGYITAASTPPDQPYGYVFSHCRITGEPGVKTDLGRPWRANAAVMFLNTEMSDVVRPAGWNNWSKPEREATARYAEYRSSGPGADAAGRVKWAHAMTDQEAQRITIENVLGGADGWNPRTGTVRMAIKLDPARQRKPAPNHAYLAASATGFSYSLDGVEWKPLSRPFPEKEINEPSLERTADGVMHLVWAAGKKRIGYAASKDLLHWSAPRYFEVMPQPEAIDVHSPELFYDEPRRRFVIFWASTIRDNFFQSYQEPVDDNSRLWYATTSDFEKLTEAKVLFDPNYTVGSGVLLLNGDRYALVHQDSRRSMQSLRVVFGPSPVGPWTVPSNPFPGVSEHACVVRTDGDWFIYQTHTLLRTSDFWSFHQIATAGNSLRCGSIIPLPPDALPGLQ